MYCCFSQCCKQRDARPRFVISGITFIVMITEFSHLLLFLINQLSSYKCYTFLLAHIMWFKSTRLLLFTDDANEDSDATITSDHEYNDDHDRLQNDSNNSSDSMIEGYRVRNSPRVVKCDEDEEFMKAFDSIMAESIQSRKQTQVVQHDMTVPVNMKRSQQQANGPNSEIKFSLLIKKGKLLFLLCSRLDK